jgi:nucleoside-diphosphate-sugar epimerase
VDRIRKGGPVIVPGDGTSLWVLTWNADFARGLVGLLGNPHALGEAFHITSDEVLTWNQIFLELFSALNAEPRILHIPSDFIVEHHPDSLGSLIGDKVNSVVFDNSKIKRFVPGFACRTTWGEGVRLALAWFAADPSRRSLDSQMSATWDKIIAAYTRARTL